MRAGFRWNGVFGNAHQDVCAFAIVRALHRRRRWQVPSWPIVKGGHLQPTQQQVDSRGDDTVRQWSRGVQSGTDHLYDEIMRGSGLALDGIGARPAWSPGVKQEKPDEPAYQ